MDRICRISKGSFIPQAREHEGSEVKPGSAGRLTGFKAFRLWRPTPRRWITPGGPPVASKGNNFLFAGETLTVQGSPLHPSSQTFIDGQYDENYPLHLRFDN